jgi:hypothetical protein
MGAEQLKYMDGFCQKVRFSTRNQQMLQKNSMKEKMRKRRGDFVFDVKNAMNNLTQELMGRCSLREKDRTLESQMEQ